MYFPYVWCPDILNDTMTCSLTSRHTFRTSFISWHTYLLYEFFSHTAPPSRPIIHSNISLDMSCPPTEHILTKDAINDPVTESDDAHVDNRQNKQPKHEPLNITHTVVESTSTTQGMNSVLSGRPITRSMSNICVGMSYPPIEQFVTEDAIDDPMTEISILTMSDYAHVMWIPKYWSFQMMGKILIVIQTQKMIKLFLHQEHHRIPKETA